MAPLIEVVQSTGASIFTSASSETQAHEIAQQYSLRPYQVLIESSFSGSVRDVVVPSGFNLIICPPKNPDLAKVIDSVSDFGRILLIGSLKPDSASLPFKVDIPSNCTFHNLDYTSLLRKRPPQMCGFLQRAVTYVIRSTLQATKPTTLYKPSQIDEALRQMQRTNESSMAIVNMSSTNSFPVSMSF